MFREQKINFFSFTQNGSIFVNETNAPLNYCLLVSNTTNTTEAATVSGEENLSITALVCGEPEDSETNEIFKWIAENHLVISLSRE
jgi:hypothetical protein